MLDSESRGEESVPLESEVEGSGSVGSAAVDATPDDPEGSGLDEASLVAPELAELTGSVSDEVPAGAGSDSSAVQAVVITTTRGAMK